jgi:hypothetical protein
MGTNCNVVVSMSLGRAELGKSYTHGCDLGEIVVKAREDVRVLRSKRLSSFAGACCFSGTLLARAQG